MKLNKFVLSVLLMLSLAACAKEVKDPIDAYPPAQQNFDRFVIYLPALADESTHKVELIVGKMQAVDCNITAFNGVLEKRSVEGWGYPYFIVEQIDGAMSTMMACPPDSPKTEQFVSLGGDNQLHRYNSRLPVVVYVPAGYDVRYRIWATGTKTFSAGSQ